MGNKTKRAKGHQGKFPKRSPRQKGKNKIIGLDKTMRDSGMAKLLAKVQQ